MSGYRGLILILILAAGVRFYALGRASYWYDEFGSLEASTGRGLAQLRLPLNQIIPHPQDLTSLKNAPPAWRIWTSLDLDNHPPLYFLLLRLTRDLLGDTEWAVRLPSVIASLAALVFFYLIVQYQLQQPAALAATALMAIAGSQISAAQDARPYSLWLALSLACGWIVKRMQNDECRMMNENQKAELNSAFYATLLCILVLALLLTHYLAAPILLSLLTYSALRLRGRLRIAAISAVILASVLFAATWGFFFIRQLQSASANNAWQYDVSPHHEALVFWHLVQLPVRWLSEPAANIAPLVILVFAACVYAIMRCRRQAGMLFWLLWCAPLIALITIMDLVRHTQSLIFARYTLAAIPALCFLAGAVMQNFRRGWLVPAALGVLSLATLPSAYSQVMDWRNVAAELRSQIQPGDTIIFTPGGYPVSWSQTTLLGIWHYAPDLPASALIITDLNPALLSGAFRPGHMTWVICFNQSILPNALDPAATVMRTGIAPSMGRVSELAP